MSNYNSTHTGAELDAAISSVFSGGALNNRVTLLEALAASGYRIAGFIAPNNSYLAKAVSMTIYICMNSDTATWASGGAVGKVYLPPTTWTPSGEGNLPSSTTGWTAVDLTSADYAGFAVMFSFNGTAWSTHRLPYSVKSLVESDIRELQKLTTGIDLWQVTTKGKYIKENGTWANNNAYNSCQLVLTNGHTYNVKQRPGEGQTTSYARLFLVTTEEETTVYTQQSAWNTKNITCECPAEGNYILQTVHKKATDEPPIIHDLTDYSQSLVKRMEDIEGTIDDIEDEIEDFTIDSVPTEDSTHAVSSGGVYDSVYYTEFEDLYIYPEASSEELYGVPIASKNHYVDGSSGEYISANSWNGTRIRMIAGHHYRVKFQVRTNKTACRVFRVDEVDGSYEWVQVESSLKSSGTFSPTPVEGDNYVLQMVRANDGAGIPTIVDLDAATHVSIKDKVDRYIPLTPTQVMTGWYGYKGYLKEQGGSATTTTETYIVNVIGLSQLKVHVGPNGTASYPLYAIMFFTTDDVDKMKLTAKTYLIDSKSNIEVGTNAIRDIVVDVPSNAICATITNTIDILPSASVTIEGNVATQHILDILTEQSEEIDEILDTIAEMNKTHLNICVLGNSYTCDSFMYVPFILQQYGITCNIHLYYRGSGSINTLIDEWEINTSTSGGHSRNHFAVDTRTQSAWTVATRLSSKSMVELESDWDMIVVTNQSVASLSPSEFDNLDELVLLINASMPNPYKLCYSIAYTRNSSDNPTLSLQTQTNSVKVNGFSEVFPVGTAIFDARQNSTLNVLGDGGNLWGSDKVHLQDGIPCYIASLTIVEKIFRMYGLNHSVMQDQLRPTEEWCDAHNIQDKNGDACGLGGSDETLNVYLAQKAAIVANNNPAEIIAI